MVRCSAVQCGVGRFCVVRGSVWCGVVRCSAIWRGVVWCGAARCGAVCRMWRGVARRGVD